MQLSWLEAQANDAPCTLKDLEAAGVTYAFLSTDPAQFEPQLAQLCQSKGYVARDEVALSENTPNLQGLKDKFKDEHLHTDDEVRFVLEGAGIFDIRSVDDRWMHIEVEPGDVLVVPAGRNHRFLLTDACRIRCVRLFRDMAGWTPVYRHPPQPAAL